MLSFIFRNIPSSHTLVDTFFNWFLMFPHHTTSLVFFFSIIKIPALLQNTPVAPTLVVAKLIFIFFSFLTIPPSCCRWNLCQFISYFLNTWYFLFNLIWISPTFFLTSYFEYFTLNIPSSFFCHDLFLLILYFLSTPHVSPS